MIGPERHLKMQNINPSVLSGTIKSIAILERAPLADSVQTVYRVVEKRNTIPVLGNLLLCGTGSGLRIEATDTTMSATITAPGAAGADFRTTIRADMLRDVLRRCKGDLVSFDAPPLASDQTVTADHRVTLESGSAKLTLDQLPADDFPSLSLPDATHSFEVPLATLVAAFRTTVFAVSTEETRYYLNGVFMHASRDSRVREPKLRFVATDGHRLAGYDAELPEGSQEFAGIIIPLKAVQSFLNMRGKLRKPKKGETAPVEMVRIEVSSGGITLHSGNLTIRSKGIDGTFPDYNRVVPWGNSDKTLRIERDDFIDVVTNASTISSERGRAVKLAMERGKPLVCTVSNPDAGDSRFECWCQYDGMAMDMGFNARYLVQMLEHMGEDVEAQLADPGSPTLFLSRGDNRSYFVLMPMRV